MTQKHEELERDFLSTVEGESKKHRFFKTITPDDCKFPRELKTDIISMITKQREANQELIDMIFHRWCYSVSFLSFALPFSLFLLLYWNVVANMQALVFIGITLIGLTPMILTLQEWMKWWNLRNEIVMKHEQEWENNRLATANNVRFDDIHIVTRELISLNIGMIVTGYTLTALGLGLLTGDIITTWSIEAVQLGAVFSWILIALMVLWYFSKQWNRWLNGDYDDHLLLGVWTRVENKNL